MERLTILFTDAVASLPYEVATMLLAMTPIGEVRLSVPVALVRYDMDIVSTLVYSVLGNMLAVGLILLALENIVHLLISRVAWLHRLWVRRIERLETQNRAAFEKWGSLALVIFVAIPLPMTGAFSGAILASIFQIPYWRAVGLLTIGTTIAAIVVTFVTLLTPFA